MKKNKVAFAFAFAFASKIGALQSSYNAGNMAQESLRTTTSPLYELSPQEQITRMERAQQGYEEDERVVCTTCTCCIWMCILGWFSLCIF
jgi:hypothetical protein